MHREMLQHFPVFPSVHLVLLVLGADLAVLVGRLVDGVADSGRLAAEGANHPALGGHVLDRSSDGGSVKEYRMVSEDVG